MKEIYRNLYIEQKYCEHDLDFFDSCPYVEVFLCKKCKIKKYVSDNGDVEWKEENDNIEPSESRDEK